MSEVREPRGRVLKILLVDDDEVDRQSVRKALESAGMEISLAEAGAARDALQKSKEDDFDCVLLDSGLPDADCGELLADLTAAPDSPPVIVLTGGSDESLVTGLMRAGAADSLTKSGLTAERLEASLLRAVYASRLHHGAQEARAQPVGSEECFRNTFEEAGVGVVHVNLDGGILRSNRRFREILGCSDPEIRGRSIGKVTHPADRQSEHDARRRLMDGEVSSVSKELRLLRKNDSFAWVNLTRSIVRSPEGEPLYLIDVVEEISVRKDAEERLKATAERLERVNQEFEQFAYVVSHDLREPLRMISSFVGLLAQRYQGRLDEQADRFIHFAVDGTRRMETLINDLLRYSRAGRTEMDEAPVLLREVVDDALVNLNSMIEDSGAQIELDDLPTVIGSRSLLIQVFQNLIQNAIKYSGEGRPKIRVAAEPSEDGVCVCVEDEGIGFAPEQGGRVFGVFQRLQPRGDPSGSGIGLAIAKRIVERQGGRIWAESVPGEGSRFYVQLRGEADEGDAACE